MLVSLVRSGRTGRDAASSLVSSLVSRFMLLLVALYLGLSSPLPVSAQIMLPGIEDAAHQLQSVSNCSCFDRHQTSITLIMDVLDTSYAHKVIASGAKRAAYQLGIQLRIISQSMYSIKTIAESVQKVLAERPAPSGIILGIPNDSIETSPLSDLIAAATSRSHDPIPFGSIHSGEYVSISSRLFHIGANNYDIGVMAANRTIQDWGTRNFTQAICINNMQYLKGIDLRCQGYQDVYQRMGIPFRIWNIDTNTDRDHALMSALAVSISTGTRLAILAISAEAGASVARMIRYAELDAQIHTQTTKPFAIVAAVEVSPTIADAIQQRYVHYGFDQGLYLQGFMSVALMTTRNRTGMALNTPIHRTGPVLIDHSTPELQSHARRELAGFPQCGTEPLPTPGFITTYTSRADVASFYSNDHTLCYHHNLTYYMFNHLRRASGFAAIVRSAMHRAAVDFNVDVQELIQESVDWSVSVSVANSIFNPLNLSNTTTARRPSGLITVRRSDAFMHDIVRGWLSHDIPVFGINAGYPYAMDERGNFLSPNRTLMGHVGMDELTLGAGAAVKFIETARVPINRVCITAESTEVITRDSRAQAFHTALQRRYNITAEACVYDRKNVEAAKAYLSAKLSQGYNSFFMAVASYIDPTLVALRDLGAINYVNIFTVDTTALLYEEMRQGNILFYVDQGSYMQGYFPVLALSVLSMTGGYTRGQKLLTRTDQSLYDMFGFTNIPYIDAGPQFVTQITARLMQCYQAATSTASMPTATLMSLDKFPLPAYAFPICIDPPIPRYQLLVTQFGTAWNETHRLSSADFNNRTSDEMKVWLQSSIHIPNVIGNINIPRGFTIAMVDEYGKGISDEVIRQWTSAVSAASSSSSTLMVRAILDTSNARLSGDISFPLASSMMQRQQLLVDGAAGSTISMHFECILPGGNTIRSQTIIMALDDFQLSFVVNATSPANTSNTHASAPYTFTIKSAQLLPSSFGVQLRNRRGDPLSLSVIQAWSTNTPKPSARLMLTAAHTGGTAAASATPSAAVQATLSGTTAVDITSSMVSFSDVSITSLPGSNVTLVIEVTLPGYTRVSSPITVRISDCVSGEYVDTMSWTCRLCQAGYVSNTADRFSCREQIKKQTQYAVNIVAVIATVLMCGVLVVMYHVIRLWYRRARIIYSYSPAFCVVALVGLLCVFASSITMIHSLDGLAVGARAVSCDASHWLFNLGFTLCYGAMLAKAYRLYRIFSNVMLRMVGMTNGHLFRVLGGLVAFDLIVLAVWQAMDPHRIVISGAYTDCVSGPTGDIIRIILIVSKGVLMLAGMYLTYKTRTCPSAFNESKAQSLAMYNCSVIAGVVLGLWFGADSLGVNARHLILSVGVLLGGASVLGLVFGNLMYNIYQLGFDCRVKKSKSHIKESVVSATVECRTGTGTSPPQGLPLTSGSLQYSTMDQEIEAMKTKSNLHPLEKKFLESHSAYNRAIQRAEAAQQQVQQHATQLSKLFAEMDYLKRTKQFAASGMTGVDARASIDCDSHVKAIKEVGKSAVTADGVHGKRSVECLPVAVPNSRSSMNHGQVHLHRPTLSAASSSISSNTTTSSPEHGGIAPNSSYPMPAHSSSSSMSVILSPASAATASSELQLTNTGGTADSAASGSGRTYTEVSTMSIIVDTEEEGKASTELAKNFI